MPVAPLAGETSTGAATCVVNDQITDLVAPPPFLAATCQ